MISSPYEVHHVDGYRMQGSGFVFPFSFALELDHSPALTLEEEGKEKIAVLT